MHIYILLISHKAVTGFAWLLTRRYTILFTQRRRHCHGCCRFCLTKLYRDEQALGSNAESGRWSFSVLTLWSFWYAWRWKKKKNSHAKEMYINHEGMFWPCRCYSACDTFICFGDPELRPSFGLSALQGPIRMKENLEKERSELRDLVTPNFLNNLDFPNNYWSLAFVRRIIHPFDW